MRREFACPGPVGRVLLSPDGRLVAGSTFDGTLFLVDRDGRLLWSFPHVDAEELTFCEASPPLLCTGTWTGALRVYVPDGVAWERPVPGIVAAIAANECAGRIVAGSWDGTVAAFSLDGTPLFRHRLPDAVVRVAVPPAGGVAVAGLADGTVRGLDATGELWHASPGGRPLAIVATAHETVVATTAGLFVLDADGRVARERPARDRVVMAALAPDASWAALVEDSPLLRLVRGEDGSAWETALPGAPSSLALAGDAGSPVCLLTLAPERLLALNRWQVPVEERLEGAASAPSFGPWGTEAVTSGPGGRSVLLHDLPAIRRWLPPPRLAVRIAAGALVAGRAGTLAVSVSNEGGRAALSLAIRVESEFLRAPRAEALGDLGPGALLRTRLAVEPERAGELILSITTTFRDELGEPVEERRQEVVAVRPQEP